jgi:hypothetical protein
VKEGKGKKKKKKRGHMAALAARKFNTNTQRK